MASEGSKSDHREMAIIDTVICWSTWKAPTQKKTDWVGELHDVKMSTIDPAVVPVTIYSHAAGKRILRCTILTFNQLLVRINELDTLTVTKDRSKPCNFPQIVPPEGGYTSFIIERSMCQHA